MTGYAFLWKTLGECSILFTFSPYINKMLICLWILYYIKLNKYDSLNYLICIFKCSHFRIQYGYEVTLATSRKSWLIGKDWYWEGLRAGGEGDDRGWDGWMASLTRWTWVWVNSGSWWWTGRPGVLRFMGLQRVGHDWATELNWTELNWWGYCYSLKDRGTSVVF